MACSLVPGCKSMKEYALENDREHEGKMTQRALQDFWRFTTDHGKKPEEENRSLPGDVLAIRDVTAQGRVRLLIDVSADLDLPEKTFQDRGFRLARHLILDRSAMAVRIRFWVRGCRRMCGMFAEITLSEDGLSFDGHRNHPDKTFRYVPERTPWAKWTKDQIALLQQMEARLLQLESQGSPAPMDAALRETAAQTGVSPQELMRLSKQVKMTFEHPQ